MSTTNVDLSAPPNRTVRTRDGVTLSYDVIGDGPETLVLANGLGGRLYAWEPLIRALVPRYRVITWDYRGLFDSSAPVLRRHLSLPDHAHDAAAILDAEGVDRAVFFGWSMGVQVSLEFATLYPERVAGLVLLNGTYGHAFSSGFQPLFRVPFAGKWGHRLVDYLLDHPEFRESLAKFAQHTVDPTLRVFSWISGTSPTQLRPAISRYMREVFDEKSFPNYLRLFQELDAHSVYHHLRDIRAPALVISGAFDWFTPAYQSREIAARLPFAESLHLLRGSHFVLLERPEVVMPAIERFLSERTRW